MRMLLILGPLLLAATAGAMSSSSSGGKTLGIRLDFEKKTLSNGIKVIVVENHTSPLVSYQTWFKVGSVDEDFGATGLAHLFEHLMFKGTERYGPKAFFQQLETKGAQVNAYTTRDYTVYYETFTPNLLEKVMDMESDRLANIKFSQSMLNREKQVVFEERRLRTDNSPAGKMQEALWSLAYQVHPYSWPVIGFPQDLANLGLKEMQAFFDKFYVPSNVLIVVVGDVKADQVFSLVKKYYGGIKNKARVKRKIKNEKVQSVERSFEMEDQVASEQFMQGYRITSAFNEESYSLDVLANILFQGRSSRAFHQLVQQDQLMNNIGGYAFTPTYPGLFLISGTMRKGKTSAEGIKALDAIIANLAEKGVTQEEVSIAVKQLQVQFIDSIRTPYGLGQLIGTVETVIGNADLYHKEVDKYLKVTPESVKAVAAKYMTLSRRSTVYMKPKKKKKGGRK